MIVNIHHTCTDFDSYRAERVKSLFNVETGADVKIIADLPIEPEYWQGDCRLGVIVGRSGTGKTSIGIQIWADTPIYNPTWQADKPIIGQIATNDSIDKSTACLSAVGLGTVPAWLRPHQVLSNGEQFRANLAKALADEPNRLIIDEFSSVVDRQIACIGASAFAKAWKRTKGKQAILLTCHYDVLDWLEPDWVYNTDMGEFTVNRGSLRQRKWQRPPIAFDIYQTNWQFWSAFEPHHYLKLPKMIAATNYIAVVNGQPVAHLAVSTQPGLIEARACRLVVLPEWQGAGIGMRFLNAVCEIWLNGNNRYNKPMRTIFHTSHPNLAQALRRDKKWTQISGGLYTKSSNKCKMANYWGVMADILEEYKVFAIWEKILMNKLKVMIVGQKWLAEQLLAWCLSQPNIKVVAVSPPNNNDRLAKLANTHKIPITLHDKNLTANQVPNEIDIILTAHAYCFVKKEARYKARFGAVGYHPSLLPKYKGKNAVKLAFDNDDKILGGSLY